MDTHTSNIEYSDLIEFGREIDDNVLLLNDFFKFKKEFMDKDSILDTLIEFSNKFGYNYEFIAQELADIPGFVEICHNDCKRFKYSLVVNTDNISNEWDD